MHKLHVGLIVCLVALANGCGSSDAPTAQQSSSVGTNNAPPTSDPIAQVAYDFFSAVLASDKEAARSRLTPLAVQRMSELGMDFLLPVSESSQFSVGNSEVIELNMAAVDTVLTEVDATGQPLREEITVVLKQENGRWGVMGVVTGMGPNEQLDGFNFEKPDQPFDASTFADDSSDNIAGGNQPGSTVPQQATRPVSEDPFRK